MIRARNLVLVIIKLGLPLALMVYLLASVGRDDYAAFLSQPKRWDLLLLAQVVALTAIVISILRWRMLVVALGIPFSVTEALRLGFLGYLLNFVSLGSVGGDLFKAILVAKEKRSQRPEAVASVLLDRAIGLLGLIILAWFAILVLADNSASEVLSYIGRAAGLLMMGSLIALLVAVYSGVWFERLINNTAHRVPWIGPSLGRMAMAVRQLRGQPLVIPNLIFSAIAVHTLLTFSICLISWATYTHAPTLQQHFMVVPPSMAVGALPIAPGGLGVQEGAIAGLFKTLEEIPENYSPILVATVYRLITVAIAGVGMGYYLASHGREFRYVKRQA